MSKLAVTRELVGKVVCSSYVTHQKVISYSWILAITRAYSPLKSARSSAAFNRKTVVKLLNFTCEWPNSQLDPPSIASLCRLVVIHSMASYVIQHDRKSIASHSWNFCLIRTFAESQVTRGGRAQVVVTNRSQSITGQSEVGRKCITAVGPWLRIWDPSLCR